MGFFKSKHSNRGLKILANLSIMCVCAYLLYTKIDFREVFDQTKDVNFSIFIATVAITLLRTWLSGLRWEALHPDRQTRLSKWSYFRLSMIAHLFNKFMPGALGGDFVKTVYAVKEQNKQRGKSVIAVFVDRTIGLVSIFIFGLIAMLTAGRKLDIAIDRLILLFFVSGGFLVILMSSRVLDYLEKFGSKLGKLQRIYVKTLTSWREAVGFYRSNSRSILYSLTLCIPIHLSSFISFYLLSQVMGMQIHFMEMVFSIAIMWLITSLPISVGGMGVRELTLVWLLGMFGVPSEQAVTLSVLGYINNILVSLLALPLLLDFKAKKEVHFTSVKENPSDEDTI